MEINAELYAGIAAFLVLGTLAVKFIPGVKDDLVLDFLKKVFELVKPRKKDDRKD